MTGWLFVAAVAIRLTALAILGLHPERYEYEEQARSLLAGEGYRLLYLGTPHLAFGPPLFGFVCAGLYRVFGDGPLSVILAQIGVSALIPVVIARIAREVGLDRRLQLVAGLPAVVHPGLIVYAVHKLHPLSFDALLLSVTVLSVVRLTPASGLGPHFRAGFVLGLSTLSRATVALFALPAAAWLVGIAPARERRRAALGIAMLLGTAALVVLPWTARDLAVAVRHILPNCLAPLLVQGTFIFAYAVLAEAILGFLGVGVPPYVPSWGNVIASGKNVIREAFWVSLFPGTTLTMAGLSLNLLGDGLRDTLDPRLRGSVGTGTGR